MEAKVFLGKLCKSLSIQSKKLKTISIEFGQYFKKILKFRT